MEKLILPSNCVFRLSFIFLACILTSSWTHSQYFDIGESQSSPSALKGEDCSLPSAWEGNWFQSGFHNLISISNRNRSTISNKGQCIETDGDKFLFYNAADKCFRCVVFHEKHANVLEYKETYCHQTRRSLPSLCSTITADYHLMSMFRVDAVPIPCPFQGSFAVSYNRGYGNCQTPVSTLNSCIHPSRIVFNYQACPDVPRTESATEEVECFATWRESSLRYLLGLIRYHYPASYDERFRCFVYEKETGHSFHVRVHGPGRRASGSNGTRETGVEVYRVAQSGDATCMGLTPNEGSKTLVLRKAIQPSPCQFPAWLLRHTLWESLNREMIYEFESSILRISNYSSPISERFQTQAVCTQIIHDGDGENESSGNANQATSSTSTRNNSENLTDKITLVLHSTTECQAGYICMKIYKREDHIIEIQPGKLSRTPERACHHFYFDPEDTPYITLTSPTPESRECPFLTTFDISSLSFSSTGTDIDEIASNCKGSDAQQDDFNGVIGSFSMGCDNLDVIELEMTRKKCVERNANEKITEKYKCLGWWEAANGDNYLVVSSDNNSSPGGSGGRMKGAELRNYEKRSCFVFYETTPSQLGELLPLSLLHSSAHGARNEEVNLDEQQKDDDAEDKDKESQQNRNLKRQFHFVRFEESCERRQYPQKRKLSDDELRIGLVFNASTSYYYENNCHTAASRRKSGDGHSHSGSASVWFSGEFTIFASSLILPLIHPVLIL